MARKLTAAELENRHGKTGFTLRDFSKYTADESPHTYLKKFEAECAALAVPEARRMQILPSLMTGLKASAAVTSLQAATTWVDMKKKFTDAFQVDNNAVITELQALRCDYTDVDKYTTEFNKIAAKVAWTSSDQG